MYPPPPWAPVHAPGSRPAGGSRPRSGSASRAHPALLAAAIDRGKSSCSSVASRLNSRSNHGLVHLHRRAVGLVHLRAGTRPSSDGLAPAKRVCGIGPSKASPAGSPRRPCSALHFTPEVAVARGVDDVDLGALVTDAHVLAQDRDAAFALQVVVVRTGPSPPSFTRKSWHWCRIFVHQRGLAVVHVGDDGDVAGVGHDGRNGMDGMGTRAWKGQVKGCAPRTGPAKVGSCVHGEMKRLSLRPPAP